MSELADYEWFHLLAQKIMIRIHEVPERSPDNPVLHDLTAAHGRCGTGSGLCDDGGHAGPEGCYVLQRIGAHLGIRSAGGDNP